MKLNAATGVLAALLVGAVVLIAVEAARGRSNHPVQIANPCVPRTLPAASGLDGTIQEVVLAGLDRAACSLGASREAVVLSIAGSSAGGGPHWTTETVTDSREGGPPRLARAGCATWRRAVIRRAVSRAADQGDADRTARPRRLQPAEPLRLTGPQTQRACGPVPPARR